MSKVDQSDRALLAAIEDGLPLVPDPYARIAKQLDTSETDVIGRLKRLVGGGVIKRFGLIVRHRALGFRANAMVVWDIPDDQVDAVAAILAAETYVTLCYRRPRRPPLWPHNLFCMIHGRDRHTVMEQIALLNDTAGIADRPNAVLFSRRCFKQRGARFSGAKTGAA